MYPARKLTPTGYFSDAQQTALYVVPSTAPPDVTPPEVSVEPTIATDGDSLIIVFSEGVTIGAGGNGGFTVSLSGGACTLAYASGDGTTSLTYTTSRTIGRNETGTLSYVQPGNGVEDTAGNDLASFSNEAIQNNSTVNNAPTDIQLSNNTIPTTAGPNATVGTLTTTDIDPDDTHTYTLVAGAGDTDNGSFNISGATLRCNDPAVLGAGVNSVRIQTDDGAATYAEAFTITIFEPTSGNIGSLTRSLTRPLCRALTRSLTG